MGHKINYILRESEMQSLNYEVLITAGEETFRRPQKVSSNLNRSRGVIRVRMVVVMMMMMMMCRVRNFRNLRKSP